MSFILLGILNAQAAGGGAGAPAYDLLETTTLASSASTITFTGLGSYTDYKHLQIRASLRSGDSDLQSEFFVNFNNDTGSNYASHRLRGNGSNVNSGAATSATKIANVFMPAANRPSNVFGSLVMDVLDFSSANKNTTTRTMSGFAESGGFIFLTSGLYDSTSAITEIDLTIQGSSIDTGSRFSLYGVK